jgi:hypothetical protein
VAAIEAQAMGLPVVCSDAGGLPENVLDGVTGFVVGRRDPLAIADRLAELAADPALRRRMGRAARRRAEDELSAERQLDGFEDLYRHLLALPVAEPAGPVEGVRGAARRERVDQLRTELDALNARTEALRLQLWRREVIEHVRRFVADTLPAGARVLVVSRGDEEIVDLAGHRGAHFPQGAEGEYAGHHPADSTDAIAQLEAQRRKGAQFLVVPATAAWWLDHYEGFARHLDQEHARIAEAPGHYVAFALQPPVVASPAPAADGDARAGGVMAA